MWHARPSSLLALLLLTAQAGPAPVAPVSAPSAQVETMRHEIENAERLHAMQDDAQRMATEQAANTLAEEKRLTQAQSDALDRLKHAEAAVEQITAHMLDLNRRRAEAQSRIDKRTGILGRIVLVLLRAREDPLEAVASTGLPPRDAVAGLSGLRALARQIVSDTGQLTQDREALDAATKAAADVRPQLAAAEAARAYEADSLARQLAETRERRESAEQEAADAARRAAAEAARAQSLRSMLQILETQRQLEEARAREDALRAERDQQTAAANAARLREAATARPTGAGTLAAAAKPSGQLATPVTGTQIRGWGDPDEGEPATGLSWRTDPGSGVVAPCGGTVAFAEPFQGYGLLVIIDCGGGFHAVLSGLDRAAVAPGQAVQNGDPIGSMRTAARTADSGASGNSGGLAPPVLYFELRKQGRPVNPAPWLRPAQ